MVKAPSKHGLERKFKPWRKGKSQNSNKRSSLKHQLRGFQRLLGKLNSDNSADDKTKETRRQELEEKIRNLESEISGKQQNLQERKNAQKAHGKRFLDRQKLVRMERKIRSDSYKKNGGDVDKQRVENELYKIALDQAYVAHHPTDVKYMPLFQRGQRVVDQSRALYRRAMTRKRIFRNLQTQKLNSDGDNDNDNKLCNWISKEQYRRLPKDWSIQEEEKVFGGSISRTAVKARKEEASSNRDDSRFQTDSRHEAMLQAAAQIESQLDDHDDEEEGQEVQMNDDVPEDDDADLPLVVGDSTDSDDSSSDDDDEEEDDANKQTTNPSQNGANVTSEGAETIRKTGDSDSEMDDADPLQQSKQAPPNQPENVSSNSSSSESEDSDSGSSSDEGEDNQHDKSNLTDPVQPKANGNSDDSSSSDDDSSSSSDSSDEETTNNKNKQSKLEAPTKGNDGDDRGGGADDDFLIDASEEESSQNVFEKTTSQIPALDEARGDKSRGWETQRQRPGAYKKKRVRR